MTETLCLDFINSRYTQTHPPYVDGLRDTAWQTSFLEKYNLPNPAPWTESEILRLSTLRNHLNALIEAPFSEKSLLQINEYLSLSPLQINLVLKEGILQRIQVPKGSGFDLLIYELADSLARLLTGTDAKRIKYCENPECRWVFLDETRNGSRKWCSTTCSSLFKVREFRARQRRQIDALPED